MSSSGMGKECPHFDVVYPAFPLPITVSPTPQGALKDGFTEAVVACDLPEPGKLPSLDSCQKRFRWTGKKADLALHSDVGLVLQEGDAEKFPQALGFESLDPFFQSQQAGSIFHSVEEELVQLELACDADGVAPPDPV